jgi:hypothetical protein
LQRERGPLLAVKALLGLISRPILDLCNNLKAIVTTRYKKEFLRKSRYILS